MKQVWVFRDPSDRKLNLIETIYEVNILIK